MEKHPPKTTKKTPEAPDSAKRSKQDTAKVQYLDLGNGIQRLKLVIV